MIPTLLEVRVDGEWRINRIVRNLDARTMIDILPMFAVQLKIGVENLRVKVLRNVQVLADVENAIVEQVRQQMINEGTAYE